MGDRKVATAMMAAAAGCLKKSRPASVLALAVVSTALLIISSTSMSIRGDSPATVISSTIYCPNSNNCQPNQQAEATVQRSDHQQPNKSATSLPTVHRSDDKRPNRSLPTVHRSDDKRPNKSLPTVHRSDDKRPKEGASSLTVHRFDNGIIKVRDSMWSKSAFRRRLSTLNVSALEGLYETMLLELTSECSTNRRLGRTDDGGWNLCLTGPFRPKQPCFSFSFGINDIWEFDDEVAALFKCHVVTFDPSMSLNNHVRNYRISFLREGLYASKGTLNSWTVDSYLGFLKRFKSESYIIDILKIDIEHSEWPALATAVRDGSLRNVKQLLLETHLRRKATAKDYIKYFAVMEALHRLGFRLWHYNWNTFGTFKSKYNGKYRTCCHELYYININFLTANISARNPSSVADVDLRTLLPVTKTLDFGQLEELRRIDLKRKSETQLEEIYYSIVGQQHVACPFSNHIGGDNGIRWDVCFSRPFGIQRSAPCVVFSFSTNRHWKYDDELAVGFRCKVHMFNPRISDMEDRQLKETSWFYRTGLGPENKVNKAKGWKQRTLCHLIEKLGYADKTVDIVKIDIEHWEWSSLERAIQEGCLSQVKQLLFESHTSEIVGRGTDYAHLLQIWMGLFNAGFRSWKSHNNSESPQFMSRSGVKRSCCYGHYMLNTRFIKL